MTSSGRVKDRKKVERGKRYLKKISPVKDAQAVEPSSQTTASTTSAKDPELGQMPDSEGMQHNRISQPSSPTVLDNSLGVVGNSVDWQSNTFSMDLQGPLSPIPSCNLEVPSGPSWMGANPSPPTTNTIQQLALPTNESSFDVISGFQITAMQRQPEDWTYECFGSRELDFLDVDYSNFEAFPQFLALGSPSRSSQNPSAEADVVLHYDSATHGSGSLVGRNLSLGFRKELLRTLPSVEFEAFLSGKGMALTSKPDSASKPSLSGSFTLRIVVNMLYNLEGTTARCIDRAQTSFRTLRALTPDTSGAVISEQQMTESSMIRMLLFSMMNGFAGLNDIPIDRLLPCLRRLKFFNTSFVQFLLGAPSHTSRTFVDNLFRAAIDARDEEIVQLLLRHHLVDVNNTICYTMGMPFTPVERAASLQAFNIIQTLVDYGAEVDKTYARPYIEIISSWSMPRLCGALPWLLSTAAGSLRNPWVHPGTYFRTRAPTPELINTLQLLIEKGSKVPVLLLGAIVNSFSTHEVGSLLSRSISIADHRAFFEPFDPVDPVDRLEHGSRYAEVRTIAVSTAKLSHAETSSSIMANMVKICKSHGGSCLAEFPNVVECAAVEGALRGRLEVVELLIDYAKCMDRILSAAIRSGNPDLIQFLLCRKPSLNPPARYLRSFRPVDPSLDSEDTDYLDPRVLRDVVLTTPLAEAVRAGNDEMIRLLETESCGAFASLTDHRRLEAAILGAVDAGDISYLRRLLSIASNTKVKFRIPDGAIKLALENGHEGAGYLLIEEGAKLSIRSTGLELALRKRDPKMVAAILATDIDYMYSSITEAALEWAEPSVMESLLHIMPDMDMPGMSPQETEVLANFCLHCMETNNLELFQLFMESTSDGKKNLDGCLAMSIRKGHRRMALYMLQIGANPSNPSVLAAAIPDRPEMLSLLFGDDIQERQQTRAPRKCIGAYLLRFLMSENGENPEAQALDQLLATGAINLIVPEVIPVSKPWPELRVTPLGLALIGIPGYCNTNVAAIQKFLQAGADPNGMARLKKYPYRCETALMVALETGREDVVSLMLDKGADVNLQPRLSLRRTPLQYAAELGALDMIRLLLRKGADVNSPPAFQGGGTALQFAAISGNCNAAAELMEQGASLDIRPSKVDGRWPLEGAAEHGRLDMIQLLWNAREVSPLGVGFEKRQCLRAMDFARENGHMGCRDLIAELSGLSVDMLDTEDYGVPWLAY